VPEATATDGPALLGLKLYGGDDDDPLNGGLFHDKLDGGGGDDALNGGANGDLLDGGPGQDVLTGGPGGDTFVFGMDGFGGPFSTVPYWEHESTVSYPDYINDFSQAEGDKIDLFEINFYTQVLYTSQGLHFIGDNAFSGTAGEFRYEVFGSKNYTAIAGDTDGDGQADFRINVAGTIDFIASDFLL